MLSILAPLTSLFPAFWIKNPTFSFSTRLHKLHGWEQASWASRVTSMHSPDWWEDGPSGRLSKSTCSCVCIFLPRSQCCRSSALELGSSSELIDWPWVLQGWLRCGRQFWPLHLKPQDTAARPKPHTTSPSLLTAKFQFTHLILLFCILQVGSLTL